MSKQIEPEKKPTSPQTRGLSQAPPDVTNIKEKVAAGNYIVRPLDVAEKIISNQLFLFTRHS